MASEGGHEQGRPALVVGGVDVGAVLQEEPDIFDVSEVRAPDQRGGSPPVSGLDVVDQDVSYGQLAGLAADRGRGLAVVAALILRVLAAAVEAVITAAAKGLS